MASTILGSAAAPVKDESYYLTLATFLVEGRLFRVPRDHFEKISPTFADMFASPPGDDTPEGTSDENPIRLDGIASKDFISLLKVLIPLQEMESSEPLSQAEWLAVLELSHRWDIDKIRKLAITMLTDSPMGEVERVAIAHKYDVEAWLIPAYTALGIRPDPLTVEEIQRLGLAFAVKMAHLREVLARHANHGNGCPRCGREVYRGGWGNHDADINVESQILEVFGDPIKIL